MGTLIYIVVVVLALLFLANLHIRFWRKRYALVMGSDLTYYTRARDGWRLALHRYRGGDGDPVVLCHGMGANGYNMDLGDRLSLARYLKRRGYDTWNLELRGAGYSRIRDRARGAPRRWCFDDHVLADVPAAIDLVLAESGKKQLHWVGHSLGGMVMLAHLSVTGDDRVASVCALASPMSLDSVGRLRFVTPLLKLLGHLPTLPARAAAAFGIPFWRSIPVSLLTHQGSNADTEAIRAAMSNLVEPVHPMLLAQVAKWLSSRRLVSLDGKVDYAAGLAGVTTPGCFIVGSGDRLAHPDDVRSGFERLNTPLKEFYLVGKATGARDDYGHGDLAVGRNAPNEIYNLVEGWLDDRRHGRRHPRTALTREEESKQAPIEEAKESPRAAFDLHPNPYDPYARQRRERTSRQRDTTAGRRLRRLPAWKIDADRQ